MFIVSQLMTNKEKNNLKDIFTALDKNGDGMLTQEELLEGYKKFYKSEERAKAEVKYLMENADSDNNGTIDYTEFLMAMANKKNLLSKANVKRAFDLFDSVTSFNNQDGSGFISPDEIKMILGKGKRFSEETWKEIIEQVDMNKDGQIS